MDTERQTDRPSWQRSRIHAMLVAVVSMTPLVALGYNLAALIGDAADLSSGTVDVIGLAILFGIVIGFAAAMMTATTPRRLLWYWLVFAAILLMPTVILYASGNRPDIS